MLVVCRDPLSVLTRRHVSMRTADGLPQEAKSLLRSRLAPRSGSFEQAAPVLAQIFRTVISVVQVSSCSAIVQPLHKTYESGCRTTMLSCQPTLVGGLFVQYRTLSA